jgi:antitoxin component YwqK of YwqJK toxin-antitoxin module
MKNNLRLAISLVIVTAILTSCDKHEKRETKHDNGQLKEQFSVLETEGGSFIKDGDYKTWFESGQQESIGQFEDGKKQGNWKTWYKNGQMQSDLNYVQDTIDGKYIRWYENGQKLVEGTTKKTVDIGEYTSWYENGQMNSKFNYTDGRKEGLQVSWYDNGQKASEYTLVNGKIEGEFKNWGKDRKLITNRTLKNGIDPILPKKYKNKSGSTIEILQGDTFKLNYQVSEWFRTSWKTETGTLKISDNGLLVLDEYKLFKFNNDTLGVNIFRGAEYNIFKATEK